MAHRISIQFQTQGFDFLGYLGLLPTGNKVQLICSGLEVSTFVIRVEDLALELPVITD
jgi:hypothetical protein